MGASPITDQQYALMRQLRDSGMTYDAIARAVGRSRSAVIRQLAGYIRPDRAAADEPDGIQYWPRVAPPPPTVPAAVALDYRLSPRERALRQHNKR